MASWLNVGSSGVPLVLRMLRPRGPRGKARIILRQIESERPAGRIPRDLGAEAPSHQQGREAGEGYPGFKGAHPSDLALRQGIRARLLVAAMGIDRLGDDLARNPGRRERARDGPHAGALHPERMIGNLPREGSIVYEPYAFEPLEHVVDLDDLEAGLQQASLQLPTTPGTHREQAERPFVAALRVLRLA